MPAAPAASVQQLSTEYNVGQDAITAVQTKFPSLAWLLTIPELGSQIIQWAQTVTDPTQAEAMFESTTWYQTHGDAVRKWLKEVNQDPATAQQDLEAQKANIAATINQLGMSATPQQLTDLATASLANGWSDQETKVQIGQMVHPNDNGTFTFNYESMVGQSTGVGTLGSSVASIQATAAKYLVPVSESTAQSFALQIAEGTMDPTAVDAYFQAHAESLYPSIAGAIKQGITPAQYVSPYKEVAAQLLGVTSDSIDMSKPQYQRALSSPGPGGVPTAMSLYDWQQTLMQDPQYGYKNSVNAKDRASSISAGLAEMFGKSPSGPSGSTAFSSAGAPRIAGVPVN